MKRTHQLALGALACAASATSLAHTGHGTDSFQTGLVHPLAADHLLVIVAVGIWSAAVFGAERRVFGAIVFMAALLAGATAGLGAPAGGWLEPAVAASVAVFGALLLAPTALPRAAALCIVALAAALHGFAHGAELPSGASFAAYAAGFLATTAGALVLGVALGHLMLRAQRYVWALAAALLGSVSLFLLTFA